MAQIHVVVGAGGPTGGPYMWAILDVIEAHTGWRHEDATTIIGTSAGAFLTAHAEPQEVPNESGHLGALELFRSAENSARWTARPSDFVVTAIRRLIGIGIAAVAPLGREQAEYGVPEAPYHPGARVVAVRRRGKRIAPHLVGEADPVALVRASAAIPFVNGPIEIDGAWHVDGAVCSPTNADLIEAESGDVVVVLAPMVPQSGGSISSRAHRAMLRVELAPAIRRGASVLVVAPTPAAHKRRKDREFFTEYGKKQILELVQNC